MRVLTTEDPMSRFDLILKLLPVIVANPICRHDLIMAAIYGLAVPAVIFFHRHVWAIYLMASVACFVAALEAATVF
jgi:hypothetical protein